MACLSAIIKWVLPILVALYGVYYWQFIASRRYFVSDVVLNGKTVIVTGKPMVISARGAYFFQLTGCLDFCHFNY